jgi:hypothetical protein
MNTRERLGFVQEMRCGAGLHRGGGGKMF